MKLIAAPLISVMAALIVVFYFHTNTHEQPTAENVITRLPKCDFAVNIYNDVKINPKNWILITEAELTENFIERQDSINAKRNKSDIISAWDCVPLTYSVHTSDYLYLNNDTLKISIMFDNNTVYIEQPQCIIFNKTEDSLLLFIKNDTNNYLHQQQRIRIYTKARKEFIRDSLKYIVEVRQRQRKKDSINSVLFKCN